MSKLTKGILIVVAVLLIASLVTVTTLYVLDKKDYQNAMENGYRKSYYEAADSIADIGLKLEKLKIAGGVKTQNNLLTDIWLDAEMAASSLGNLAAKDAPSENMIKYFNQLGDYCKYLAAKNTQGLSYGEKEKLDALYKVVTAVKESFDATSAKILDGENLAAKLSEGIQLLGDGYEHFNNDSSVEYPEMIYDGPFSDGLTERQAKYLEGLTEIDAAGAINAVSAKFLGAENLSVITENKGSVPSYLVGFTMDGVEQSATVTKSGGLIASYSSAAVPTDTLIDINVIVAGAGGVVRDFGYDGLSVVWYTNEDSTVYVNMAYKQDGVIFYPDIVKLKFSGEDGKLLAMDAMGYLYNHTARTTPTEVYTIAEAAAKVSGLLAISSTKLTVIPTEWNTEEVAYEFVGSYNSEVYYVYISATTLEEIKVMKVVEENGGTLVG